MRDDDLKDGSEFPLFHDATHAFWEAQASQQQQQHDAHWSNREWIMDPDSFEVFEVTADSSHQGRRTKTAVTTSRTKNAATTAEKKKKMSTRSVTDAGAGGEKFDDTLCAALGCKELKPSNTRRK